MDARAAAAGWLARDPDPATRAELEALVAAGDEEALRERFSGRLAFGTAGLRATMGVGPMRMNRIVVRESAAGIARHLIDTDPRARKAGVVVVHDARHNSADFAADCAVILAGHGIPVHAGQGPLPTPVGVYAIRHLGCAAGIVITASHNPATDNGLKLYMGDGAQIVPPIDSQVAARIDEVAADGVLEPGIAPAPVTPLPDAVIDDYCRDVRLRVPGPARPLRIATTAMHGVGGALLARVLAEAGYHDVHPVAAQEHPDPDFPTVSFPNPEEPGATDLLAARMAEVGADLGLAVDPDADRVAVLVPTASGARQLTGDEVGAVLGEWLLAEVTAGPHRLTVTSVVSSSLLGRIAAAHGAHHVETLTGFKYLSRPAMENPTWTQVLAYEEAIGYAVGADVRDKDGIGAAVAVAAMTASGAARGETLPDRLDALHRRHGAHVTGNFSLRYEGVGWRERRDDALTRVVASPPERIGDDAVAAVAHLAPDVMRIDLERDLRVIVRPSGTEPKLKCYCEAVERVVDGDLVGARARAAARLAATREALRALLGA